MATPQGVPQGTKISPLLANVYPHSVDDPWVQHWRRRHVRGDMIVVRCADDTIVGFEHEADAERFLAALPVVYPNIPVQRCWAHKIRNIVAGVRAADRSAIKVTLHAVMKASNLVAARSAAAAFARRWRETYPKAVASLRRDLDELLACFRLGDPKWRRMVRTTNAIERRFREVRRRTRPMDAFADRTSIERILFAVFTHENKNQGIHIPFPLTQNS